MYNQSGTKYNLVKHSTNKHNTNQRGVVGDDDDDAGAKTAAVHLCAMLVFFIYIFYDT